jgi:hypothetical protein
MIVAPGGRAYDAAADRTAAMIEFLVAFLVFVSVLAGAMVGMWLRHRLPAHHVDEDSLDVIKSMTGMISVLAALVLGLLAANVRSDFEGLNSQVRDFGAQLVMLDNTLRDIGAQADPARHLLLDYTTKVVDTVWGPGARDHKSIGARGVEAIVSVVSRLLGGTDMVWREPDDGATTLGSVRLLIANMDTVNHALRQSALRTSEYLLQARWILHARTVSPILPPFMLVLTFWITAVFMSFGLAAPRHATVVVAFVVCAAALASCFYMTVEMDRPFDGILSVGGSSLQDAVAHMMR